MLWLYRRALQAAEKLVPLPRASTKGRGAKTGDGRKLGFDDHVLMKRCGQSPPWSAAAAATAFLARASLPYKPQAEGGSRSSRFPFTPPLHPKMPSAKGFGPTAFPLIHHHHLFRPRTRKGGGCCYRTPRRLRRAVSKLPSRNNAFFRSLFRLAGAAP
jgi:hypothetical protein